MTFRSTRMITCLVILTLATVAASHAGPSPIAVRADANALSVESTPGFTHGMLTVRQRGVGVVYEQGFSPDQGLVYALQTDQGQPLTDGRYVFEVWVAGSSAGTQKLSGSFEIVGGAVVTETLDVDVKQDIIDVPILGDAIVEGSICVSDSTDCLLDLIILESESFDTPGFGAADIKIKDNVPEIWFADTTAEDGDFALTVEDSKFFLRDPDADTLPLTVESGAPTDSVNVTATGAVGFNTATPIAQVHVVKPTPGGNAAVVENGALAVRRLDGIAANIRFAVPGLTWLFANNPVRQTFSIRNQTDSRDPFWIHKSAQSRLLELEGDTVKTTGRIVVQGNQVHPDFVFDKDYDLMDLGELKAFVLENKHLPGLQSATEVKRAGGFDLSGLSLDLLQKVEELTRYTIQQEETISRQEELISQQEKMISEQELTLSEQKEMISALAVRIERLEADD